MSLRDGVCVCHSMPMYMDELRDVFGSLQGLTIVILVRFEDVSSVEMVSFPDKSDGKDLRLLCCSCHSVKKDVQSWIKSCRIRYERKHGRMKPFKYAICPEYGGRGSSALSPPIFSDR